RVLDTRRLALHSQVPLTALMVVYTFVSLSILAEPIVERRAPAQPLSVEIAVPEDALLPEPGSGRLQAVGAGKIAKQKLTYRVLLVVDVYTSGVPIDPEQDAVIAPPWSTLPWHLLVLMEEAVARGWAAFSQSEARRRGVDWLDLVRPEAMKGRLAGLVETFEREGYRPDPLTSLVSAEEARKRWAALKAFYKE